MKLKRYRWDIRGKTSGRDNSWAYLWVNGDPFNEDRAFAYRGLPVFGTRPISNHIAAIHPSTHPFYIVRGKDIGGAMSLKIKRHEWAIMYSDCFVRTNVTIRYLRCPESFEDDLFIECVDWLRENEVFCVTKKKTTSIHPFYYVVGDGEYRP